MNYDLEQMLYEYMRQQRMREIQQAQARDARQMWTEIQRRRLGSTYNEVGLSGYHMYPYGNEIYDTMQSGRPGTPTGHTWSLERGQDRLRNNDQMYDYKNSKFY